MAGVNKFSAHDSSRPGGLRPPVKFSAPRPKGAGEAANDGAVTARITDAHMQDFRTVRVWQKNRELIVEIYQTTSRFPADERFGLTSQMRRAAVSISSNIAEGCGRGSTRDMLRFFQMAFGSTTELLNLFIIASDLGYLTGEQFGSWDAKLLEVRKMLASFMKRLKVG